MSGEYKTFVEESPILKYDVFVSHRGPDTKNNFVVFLTDALSKAGFNPFLDAKAIGYGSDVYKSIDEALSEAWVNVVVFSKGFAESKYCLYEVSEMVQSRKVILPVFYDVKPFHVKNSNRGAFAKGFRKHRRRALRWNEITDQTESVETRLGKVEKWRKALQKVAKLRGFRLDEVAGNEQELVRQIVVAVQNHIPVEWQSEKCRFGLDDLLREVVEKVDAMGDNVGILGFHGVGGIGKTTLANELYRQLLSRGGFKASFLKDVRSNLTTELQRQLVSDITGERDIGHTNVYRQQFNRLRTQRVLIVVDDIDSAQQLSDLIVDFELYPGSRIVVTSRHKDVLNRSMGPATHWSLHEVKELHKIYSRKIFNWHAFLSDVPTEEFRDLAEGVADACHGHPLALEVIGASLYDKKDLETDGSLWHDAIKTFSENNVVFDKLRISYDSLPNDGCKVMFRDIACLLIGMREEVALEIWKSCQSCASGYCSTTKGPELVLRTLVDKSLVKIRDGVLSMHDLIRDMGRDIVKKEVPGERTHLWDPATADKVLRRNEGTDKVRGLTLSSRGSSSTVTYAAVQFEKMRELHLLVLDGCAIGGNDFSSWSEELRWLQWRWCRCTELPSHLKLQKLTVLDLTNSINLKQLWQEDALVEFPLLLRLILKNCRSVVELPQNIGHRLPRLKTLDLVDCWSIKTLPVSIGKMKNMEYLMLSDCKNLAKLPESAGEFQMPSFKKLDAETDSFKDLKKLKVLDLSWCGIQELSDSFGDLTNLEDLIMSGCGKVDVLPHLFKNLKKLKVLNLSFCGIQELPDLFGDLINLENLNMEGCTKLHVLPNSFMNLSKLKVLNLKWCGIQGLPALFGDLTNLEDLNIRTCEKLDVLPHSFKDLKKLKVLDLSGCGIQKLPVLFGDLTNLEDLNMEGCEKLDVLPHSFKDLEKLKLLNLSWCGILKLPILFGDLTNLEDLNMWECKKLDVLPHSFKDLEKLKVLNLNWCGIQELPDLFGDLTNLEDLIMRGCEKVDVLPYSFKNLKKLKVLDLSWCGIQELLDLFGDLTHLENLNMLGCEKLDVLPHSFKDLKKLKVLDLSGCGIQKLPILFGDLTNLETLKMCRCKKLDVLPHSFKDLKKLKVLDLSWCGIQELPILFGDLTNLEDLDMEGCTKMYVLPNSFMDLHKLKVLKLNESGIQITPTWFRNLTNLQDFDMR